MLLRASVEQHLDTVENPFPFRDGENVEIALEAISAVNEDGEWDAEIDTPHDYFGKDYILARTIIRKLELESFIVEPDGDSDLDDGLEDFS